MNKEVITFSYVLEDEIVLLTDTLEFSEIKFLASVYVSSIGEKIGPDFEKIEEKEEELYRVFSTFYTVLFYLDFVLMLINFEGIKHKHNFLQVWVNERHFNQELKSKYYSLFPIRMKKQRRIHSKRKA